MSSLQAFKNLETSALASCGYYLYYYGHVRHRRLGTKGVTAHIPTGALFWVFLITPQLDNQVGPLPDRASAPGREEVGDGC